MRMRKRHNLDTRMDKCASLLVDAPEELRGQWRSAFFDAAALRLELGCGKGRFTVECAAQSPETLLVALEKVPDAMVIAMERTAAAELSNVRFIDGDAAKLCEMFAPGETERIYINFCDPWPKSRDAKFRLTAPSFLRMYHDILTPDGEIHFKTDNAPLFDWSVGQLTAEGWAIRELTRDLHGEGGKDIPMTDYELRFVESGLKINRLVAVKTEQTKGTADGAVPRLRNSALSDARGK